MTQRSSAGGDKPTANLKAEIQAAADRGYRFYVYTLSDAQGVFYVGKGQKHRVFQHEKLQPTDRNMAKRTRIAGCAEQPIKAIVAYFGDEGQAYEYERRLIAEGAETLTNVASGGATPRCAAIAYSQSILARMQPLDVWRRTISERNRAFVVKHFGSLDALYAKTIATLKEQIADPTPTYLVVRGDGSHSWTWR